MTCLKPRVALQKFSNLLIFPNISAIYIFFMRTAVHSGLISSLVKKKVRPREPLISNIRQYLAPGNVDPIVACELPHPQGSGVSR